MSHEVSDFLSNGQLITIPGIHPTIEFRSQGESYSKKLTPQVVSICGRLGLELGFGEILTQHLSDLNLVIATEGGISDLEENGAYLTVQKFNDTSLRENQDDQDDKKIWKRLLVVGFDDIGERARMLRKAIKQNDAASSNLDERQLRIVALDWLYGEQAAVAVNNACHMQRTFGRYIPDFNGQSQNARAGATISIEFLKGGPYGIHEISDDSARFRKGFGYAFLRERVLARKLLHRDAQAGWVVNTLRQNDEVGPYGEDEIESHLRSIVSIPGRVDVFKELPYDPEILDDEFDFLSEGE